MSGCIVVSDPLVDELIEFHADAPGHVTAQCTACDAYTTGGESNVEDWAHAHIDSAHRGGRHTAWLRKHEPLVLDQTGPGHHSESAAEIRGVWLRWHDGSDVGSVPGFRWGGRFAR